MSKAARLKIMSGQNDIVIAHGTVLVNEGSSVVVTFDYALPYVPQITATPISTNPDDAAVSISNITTSDFTLYAGSKGGDFNVSWIAVS